MIFILPNFAMWFLPALFFMKMFLPIWDKLRYPVLFSLIMALLFGFLPLSDDYFGIKRLFIFLPIFLIGFYYDDYKKILRKRFKSLAGFLSDRIAFIAISAVVFFIAALVAKYVPFYFLENFICFY